MCICVHAGVNSDSGTNLLVRSCCQAWVGSESGSPRWERSLGGMLQKRTQSDFPWCGWRDKHLPSSGSESGEMRRRERDLSSLPTSQMFMPFHFFQSLWHPSEGRWAPRVTMGNENSTSDHQVGSGGFSASCCAALLIILAPQHPCPARGKGRHSPLDPCDVSVPVGHFVTTSSAVL